MAGEASQSTSLKVLVEKEKNRIVFVEADEDFLDVIFSFLTLPLATIVRLTREHFLKGDIGCLNNLYESLEKFDKELLSEHKEMLLHPLCATDVYCRSLKVNLVEGDKRKYYRCSGVPYCGNLSYYQTRYCRCGRSLMYEVDLLDPVPEGGGGFIKPHVRFMITDDFQLLHMSTMAGLSLLSNLGTIDGSKIEERMLNIGKDEVNWYQYPRDQKAGCEPWYQYHIARYRYQRFRTENWEPVLAPLRG
ncbi:hypothetical protein Vadar_016247 [Vaccinium darrowii]|uniref:Uncharacterized protein n=1 Tax=Vaccinium darrowii TaxID=229202 RepID=A0ACB7X1M4_9ERIC|nr:hypothetical protein Vadar_016247 [Vaccinium darrowii]